MVSKKHLILYLLSSLKKALQMFVKGTSTGIILNQKITGSGRGQLLKVNYRNEGKLLLILDNEGNVMGM